MKWRWIPILAIWPAWMILGTLALLGAMSTARCRQRRPEKGIPTMSTAPPSLNAPAAINLASYLIPGVAISDPWAAHNPGTLAVNLSADHGIVSVTGHSGSAIALHETLAAANALLATLAYKPPALPVVDRITLNVWNQAGVSATLIIAVTPTPVTPPPSTGTQARRIGDFLAMTGSNLFPSMSADTNTWGAYPADYSPASVFAAMQFLVNGGPLPVCRCYVYGDYREAILAQWLPGLALAGMPFSLAIAGGGTAADVPALLRLAENPTNGVVMIEGINEPNTDFGTGITPPAVTIAAQQALSPGRFGGRRVAGPAIVAGVPNPVVYITPGYASAADISALTAWMDVCNGHLYPPSLCDLDDGSGMGALDDLATGLARVYAGKPVVFSEWHPTLFGVTKGDDALDAYYAPICLLSAWRAGIRSMQWFSLFDYGDVYRCGMFEKDATTPRPVAWALRALHTLAGDHGSTARTFMPGKVNYSVNGGAPPINAGSPHTGTQSALFQASDGRIIIPVWNAQVAPGGPVKPVSVWLGAPASSIVEYGITGDSSALTPRQTVNNASSIVLQMDACIRLLVITP